MYYKMYLLEWFVIFELETSELHLDVLPSSLGGMQPRVQLEHLSEEL